MDQAHNSNIAFIFNNVALHNLENSGIFFFSSLHFEYYDNNNFGGGNNNIYNSDDDGGDTTTTTATTATLLQTCIRTWYERTFCVGPLQYPSITLNHCLLITTFEHFERSSLVIHTVL